MKIGFAQAVRERGDKWLYADVPAINTSGNGPHISNATWIAMRSRNDGEARSKLTMELCTAHGRLFQVEQPVFRCGCNGLCPKHPACPGVVYDPQFPYLSAVQEGDAHGKA